MSMKQIIDKFIVNLSVINKDSGETKEYDSAVTAIAIKKDYVVNVFPLYVVSLYLPKEDRDYIVNNNVYFHLTVYKYDASELDDSTSGEESYTSPTITGTVIDEDLRIFDKAIINVSEKITDTTDESSEQDNIKEQKVSYDVSCIPSKYLAYNNGIINESYIDANLNEIMLNIISSVYSGKLIMEESKNAKRYDCVVIPPMCMTHAIYYLNEYYGVYEVSLNMFFDNDTMYLYDIDADPSKRTYNSAFYINVIKTEDSENSTIYGTPQYDTDNDDIYLKLPNDPLLDRTYDKYRYSTGGTAIFTSYDSKLNLVTRDYVNDKNEEKVRYYWNNLSDPVFEKRSMHSFYQAITVSMPNIDSSKINPDTKVTVSGSSSSEVNGTYTVLGTVSMFSAVSKNNAKNFTNMLSISLGQHH